MDKAINSISLLKSELQARQRRNTSYSLRSFARDLDVPSGRVSEYFSGKRSISPKVGEKIARKLKLSSEKRNIFLTAILQEKYQINIAESEEFKLEYLQLRMDQFEAIADWQHYAILSLMETDDFKNDPEWIAHRLNIAPELARRSLDILLKLKLIKQTDKGIALTHNGITTTHDIESEALKESHYQNLELAEHSLKEHPVELRDITSITMAIDIKKIPIAKKMIKEFRSKLSHVLESDERNEVYNMNVQLIPLTNIGKRINS